MENDHGRDEKDFVLDCLTDCKRELLAKRDRLLVPRQELDQEIEHVTGTMRSLQRPSTKRSEATIVEEFPIGKLRKLTPVQALLVMAAHNNGLVRARQAFTHQGWRHARDEKLNKHHSRCDRAE
jgi:hypothetical protein